MAPVTYQTIRLRRGRHKNPEDGACVMELASMLAGERFSDHPLSVCPVIGAFLRRYNDWTGDDRRQDLYRYAATVVGTRVSDDVQRARLDRLVVWTSELRRRRRCAWLPDKWRWVSYLEIDDEEVIAGRAIREVIRHGERIHGEVLAFLDELIEMRASEAPAEETPEALPAVCETVA